MTTQESLSEALLDAFGKTLAVVTTGAVTGFLGYGVLEKVLTEASVKAAVIQVNLANPEVLDSPTIMNQMYQTAITAAERMPSDLTGPGLASLAGFLAAGTGLAIIYALRK